MGIFDMFRQPDINKGIDEYNNTPGALLLDVRSSQEYGTGHIPGSRNVPLQNLGAVNSLAKDKDLPLFVYCQSGGRSRQAAGMLQNMGYGNVKNIGGIAAYSGKVER